MARDGEIERLATFVTRGLAGSGSIHLKVDQSRITDRIRAILTKSFSDEAALEEEAERLAATHAGRMAGLDHRRVVRGIMERLAQERDFPL
jgi:hypothetical protein